MSYPKHILVIPDGNRRWAKLNKKPLDETYNYALSTITTNLISTILIKNKIEILSLYIISRKNIINRTKKQVAPILDNEINVFNEWIENKKFENAKIKFKLIGDLKILPKKFLNAAKELEKKTKYYKGPTCNLLAAYDAEFELKEAIYQIKNKKIKNILPYLELNQSIDLLIRTGKEKRLSGAPLIQSTYAELLFLDALYPELTTKLIENSISEFRKRKRKFGS